MAQSTLNYGAAANDGTGDGLRDTFIKVDDNATEIYQEKGWGYYQDAESSPATQSITTTASKLQIDGADVGSDSSFLPREIRGSSELWDTTNDNIIAVNAGDAYEARIDLEITGKTGSPNHIKVELDIGGGGSPSNVIVTKYIDTQKTTTFNESVSFPFYATATFITNGGQIFLTTDTGTATLAARAIFIKRDFNGNT